MASWRCLFFFFHYAKASQSELRYNIPCRLDASAVRATPLVIFGFAVSVIFCPHHVPLVHIPGGLLPHK
jgi:hypothetical protein